MYKVINSCRAVTVFFETNEMLQLERDSVLIVFIFCKTTVTIVLETVSNFHKCFIHHIRLASFVESGERLSFIIDFMSADFRG